MSNFITISEVKKECGIKDNRTVRRWIRDGLLPPIAGPKGRKLQGWDRKYWETWQADKARADRKKAALN